MIDPFLSNKEAQRRLGHGPAGSVMDQAAHLTGPPPDPQQQAFLQAIGNQDVRMTIGGPSQVRGIPVQPDYFTSGETFMGPPTQSAAILRNRARPMPEGHEAFLKRLYGGA